MTISKKIAGVGTLVAVAITASTPLRAEGFFEALFGTRPQQAEPAPEYYRPGPRGLRQRIYYSDRRMERRFERTLGRPTPRLARRKADTKQAARTTSQKTPDLMEATEKPKAPLVAKPMDQTANYFTEVMKDPTLQVGDIVMFPEGPRVFQGKGGERHGKGDFVPVRQAKGLPKADKKLLTALQTGVAAGWAEDEAPKMAKAQGRPKVAGIARDDEDVETTGTVSGPTR